MIRLFFISVLLFGCHLLQAQSVTYTGIILDSLNQPNRRADIINISENPIINEDSYEHFARIAYDGKYKIRVRDRDFIRIYPNNRSKKQNEFDLYQFRYDPFDDNNGILVLVEIAEDIKSNAISYQIDSLTTTDKGQAFDSNNSKHGYYNSLQFINGKPTFSTIHPHFSTLGLSFYVAGSITKAIDRNERQNQYVQGQTDQGQIVNTTNTAFSWGPEALALGIPTYQNSIFKSSYQNAESLKLTYYNTLIGKFDFQLAHKNNRGILQSNKNNYLQSIIGYEKLLKNRDVIQAGLSLMLDNEKLTMIGNSHSNILMASLLQPINFDSKSNKNNSAYPTLDNPYQLLMNTDTYSKTNSGSAYFKYRYRKNKWDITANLNGQYQDYMLGYGNNSTRSFSSNYDYYKRHLKTQQLAGNLVSEYPISDKFDLLANLFYNAQFLSLKKDFYQNLIANNYPTSVNPIRINNDRLNNQSAELQFGLKYLSNDYYHYYNNAWGINFLNSVIHSNKSNQKFGYNIQTNVTKRFNFRIDNSHFELLTWAKYHFNHIEPQQILNDLAFSTIGTSVYQANNYVPIKELLLLQTTNKLQSKSNMELGFRLEFWDTYKFEANYYNHHIKNAYVPYLTDNQYHWENAVNFNQYGLDFSLSTHMGRNNDYTLSWNPEVKFQHYRNKTTKILLNTDRIPFAGFSEISKNYIKDQPVGVLVGTAYKRNQNNEIIIDQNGYPEVANELRVIGDPNPDFNILFNNVLEYKSFILDLDFEWSKGGEIWNGTNQVLNYYGQSNETAQLRNTTNYIFKGVNDLGIENNTAVDFYTASLPITANRWVRYGEVGVAEDAIEDGSYFRMSTISLGRKIKLHKKNIRSITINLFAENLIFLSKYKGNHPHSALFGMSNTLGIDYFNSPALQKYGFNLNFEF